MKLTINVEAEGYESAYVGMAVDEPLPEKFYTNDKYIIGTLQFSPTRERYAFEYYESRDFAPGRHYIAASTNKNSTLEKLMIRIYDQSGNLLDGLYAYRDGVMYSDKQLILCFEIREAAPGVYEYVKLHDYNDWYDLGAQPFEPTGESAEATRTPLNILEQLWPMMNNMMSMMMNMMMMVAMMQLMVGMMQGMVGGMAETFAL